MTGACGAIAQDDRGNFLAAGTCVLRHAFRADSVEVMAIRSGLILAENLGCTELIIESDNMLVLKDISDPNVYMGTDVSIITECSFMAMEFASIDFVHCSREANMVADCLAKHCFRINKSESWESNVPDFILHHYVNDLAII